MVGTLTSYRESSFCVTLVSSQRIKETSLSVLKARRVRSSKFPMGVATTKSVAMSRHHHFSFSLLEKIAQEFRKNARNGNGEQRAQHSPQGATYRNCHQNKYRRKTDELLSQKRS